MVSDIAIIYNPGSMIDSTWVLLSMSIIRDCNACDSFATVRTSSMMPGPRLFKYVSYGSGMIIAEGGGV